MLICIMLDIKYIRENPGAVRRNCSNKNDKSDVTRLLELDLQRRTIIQTVEELKNTRNVVSNEISLLKKQGQDATEKITSMREVGDRIKGYDEELRNVDADIESIMLLIPNIAHESVPVGATADENVEV